MHRVDAARVELAKKTKELPTRKRKRDWSKADSLRDPGRVATEAVELDTDKKIFLDDIINVMQAARVVKTDPSATEPETEVYGTAAYCPERLAGSQSSQQG